MVTSVRNGKRITPKTNEVLSGYLAKNAPQPADSGMREFYHAFMSDIKAKAEVEARQAMQAEIATSEAQKVAAEAKLHAVQNDAEVRVKAAQQSLALAEQEISNLKERMAQMFNQIHESNEAAENSRRDADNEAAIGRQRASELERKLAEITGQLAEAKKVKPVVQQVVTPPQPRKMPEFTFVPTRDVNGLITSITATPKGD